MKLKPHPLLLLIWTVLLALTATLTGCLDPAYRTKRAIRDGWIDRDLMLHLAREDVSPENIEALAELDKELQKRYSERLDKTFKMIHERYEYDNRRWEEMRPIREERLRRLLEGKPEEIPEAWRKMTY